MPWQLRRGTQRIECHDAAVKAFLDILLGNGSLGGPLDAPVRRGLS
ncbi:MAG: hypothetical protein NTW96_06010 [Planctomycetia bacterium]|nr:hypothetical protein [Planctomycetia bacterium]